MKSKHLSKHWKTRMKIEKQAPRSLRGASFEPSPPVFEYLAYIGKFFLTLQNKRKVARRAEDLRKSSARGCVEQLTTQYLASRG